MPASSRMNPESRLLVTVDTGYFYMALVDQDGLELRPLMEGRVLPSGHLGLVNLGWVVNAIAEYHHIPHMVKDVSDEEVR